MKRSIILLGLCLCLVLSGCITEYEATGIDEVADILVVEGMITDDESYIRLSHSVQLTNENNSLVSSYINDAKVYIECDDATQLNNTQSLGNGQYSIITGKLDSNQKYRLKILIEEYEYCSDYSFPLKTPEIDSIVYVKKGLGQPVHIYVATHDTENKILYYRWSYKEDWEINSVIQIDNVPRYCWNKANNKSILLGTAEKTIDGRTAGKITEIMPFDKRLSVLYRINVTQNAISKRAYDYFSNIKKNIELTGSIFTPVPAELKGNITCITDPDRPVIGYVDVSITTNNHRYISRQIDNLYEPLSDCISIRDDPDGDTFIPDDYIKINEDTYAPAQCVDCTYHGTEQKPDDWPK